MSADSEHKRNNASGASRWISCPGSIRQYEALPEPPETEAQRRGTHAHLLLEKFLRFGPASVPLEDFDDVTIENVTWAYEVIRSVRQEGADAGDSAFLVSELRADLAHRGMPECGGTTDALLVLPRSGVMHVFDYKNGHVFVSEYNNAQMMIYALCNTPEAYCVSEVVLHVLQPNVSRVDRFCRISVERLNAWCDFVLKPAYDLTFQPDAPLIPKAEEQCRWCRARGACLACQKAVLESDFGKDVVVAGTGRLPSADVIGLDRVGELLRFEESVLSPYFAGLRSFAFSALCRGESVPGFKLVRGRKNRVFKPEAIAELTSKIPKDLLYQPPAMKSPAQLEKVPGYKELVKSLAYVPEGDLKMVVDTDVRPVVGLSASDEFTTIDVEGTVL